VINAYVPKTATNNMTMTKTACNFADPAVGWVTSTPIYCYFSERFIFILWVLYSDREIGQ
jgi:hypothetical protein